MVGPDQVVRSGLGGRVGAVGPIGGLLREERPSGPRLAEHLVGAHVVEQFESVQPLAGQLEQLEGADDIGLDEGVGRHDGPVHVGFGGKVADRVDPVGVENAFHGRGVADVRPLEHVAPVLGRLDVGQVFRVARIGQAVHIDDAAGKIRCFEQVADEVRTDEAAAAGHQDVFHDVVSCSTAWRRSLPCSATNRSRSCRQSTITLMSAFLRRRFSRTAFRGRTAGVG